MHTPMIIENGAGIAIPTYMLNNYISCRRFSTSTLKATIYFENLDPIKELDIELNGYHDLPKQKFQNRHSRSRY